jgi:hypothetical protein
MHLRNTGQKQVLYCEQCQLSLVVPQRRAAGNVGFVSLVRLPSC